MLPEGSPHKLLVNRVASLLHAEKLFEAAKHVADFVRQNTGHTPRTDTRAEAAKTVWFLLQWCLDNNGREEAAQILWPRTLFDPRPESTQRVWKALDEQNFMLMMGAGSMSKSFSAAVWFFCEWLRDPEFTTVKVLGPSEQHLEDNLFTHLVTLHRSASLPLPGTINSLFIGMDTKQRKSSISGVVIPLGKKSAGRLQGTKRVPRKTPHPIFGPLSRMFIFLDEIANIPKGIWRDIDNLLSNAQGDAGLKIVGAFNPTDQNDEVGTRCEPTFGWNSFDPDQHYEWMSKRGWFVLRLDAARCENVLAGKVIFPGLQTLEGFNQIIANSGGTNSPGYWAMARGCFPPTGTPMTIMPQGLLAQFLGEPVWYEKPRGVAGVDIALQGGDTAVFAKGLYGMATAFKLAPSLMHPNGVVVQFKNKKNQVIAIPMLWLEAIFRLPKGDTVSIRDEIVRLCRQTGVSPEWLCVDRTGNGAGVHDLLKSDWHVGVMGINFYQGASETKILVEDSGTAKELYDRAQTELLFAVRKWVEFGYLKGSPSLATAELYQNLTTRLYRPMGNKSKAETKDDYKSRNQGKSPDEGDAVSLMVAAARKASGMIPSMTHEKTETTEEEDDDWGSGNYVDVTNRYDNL